MTPEQRAAKRARWRKWYNANKQYRQKQKPLTREQRDRRNAYQNEYRAKRRKAKMIEQLSMLPEVPAKKIEEVHLIKAEVVQRDERRLAIESAIKEGRLPRDYKPPVIIGHVCHFYPPSYRCICGKQQDQPPMVVRARSVFVPFEQEGVRV